MRTIKLITVFTLSKSLDFSGRGGAEQALAILPQVFGNLHENLQQIDYDYDKENPSDSFLIL
jgi:hypothetical protein